MMGCPEDRSKGERPPCLWKSRRRVEHQPSLRRAPASPPQQPHMTRPSPTCLKMQRGGKASLGELGDDDDSAGACFRSALQSYGLPAEARWVEDHHQWNGIAAGELLSSPQHASGSWTHKQEVIEAYAWQSGGMEEAARVDDRDGASGGGESSHSGQHR